MAASTQTRHTRGTRTIPDAPHPSIATAPLEIRLHGHHRTRTPQEGRLSCVLAALVVLFVSHSTAEKHDAMQPPTTLAEWYAPSSASSSTKSRITGRRDGTQRRARVEGGWRVCVCAGVHKNAPVPQSNRNPRRCPPWQRYLQLSQFPLLARGNGPPHPAWPQHACKQSVGEGQCAPLQSVMGAWVESSVEGETEAWPTGTRTLLTVCREMWVQVPLEGGGRGSHVRCVVGWPLPPAPDCPYPNRMHLHSA